MTLRKWIYSLYNHETYKCMLYMGGGFYTEIDMKDLLSKYGEHSKFVIKIEQDTLWIVLKKPWKDR